MKKCSTLKEKSFKNIKNVKRELVSNFLEKWNIAVV
jgi:hypothetical protein